MRTFKEIADLKKRGARKWGKDLVKLILPMLNENKTYHEIIFFLKENHSIDFNVKTLSALVNRNRESYKIPVTIMNIDSTQAKHKATQGQPVQSNRENKEIVQNEEIVSTSSVDNIEKDSDIFAELEDYNDVEYVIRQEARRRQEKLDKYPWMRPKSTTENKKETTD